MLLGVFVNSVVLFYFFLVCVFYVLGLPYWILVVVVSFRLDGWVCYCLFGRFDCFGDLIMLGGGGCGRAWNGLI